MGSPLLGPVLSRSTKEYSNINLSQSFSVKMATMAYANFKRRANQMKHDSNQQQNKSSNQETSFGCFTPSEQDFGAKQMTSVFEENNKNLTKKWACDEDGVSITSKWFPITRVRTFSFSGADFLPGQKVE